MDTRADEMFGFRLRRWLPPSGPARWLILPLYLLLVLALLYAVGRPVQVWLGSFYSGSRAPYLQLPTPDAVTLRWQTPTSEIGVVRYGLRPDRLQWEQREARAGEEHRLRLDGLRPDTRYYYAVGNPREMRYAGAGYWFHTPPTKADVPVRLAVLGDPGAPTAQQRAVRNALMAWLERQARPDRPYLDLLLTTGDNAYRSGTNEQFQRGFFEPFGALLRNVPVIPAHGNHDARRRAFYQLFDFPTRGEAGGVPSGSEHYFSMNWGPLHLIMLDTASRPITPDHPMLEWLRRDLAATRQPWRVAVFHHPPYTHGSHNSDRRSDSRGRMFEVREHVLPVLEAGGIDLVLAGHSHMYERSHLLDCHYATSAKLDRQASLREPEPTPEGPRYRKPLAPGVPHAGAIYVVVGATARADGGPLDHPVMAVSQAWTGALVIDIEGSRLVGRYLREDGRVGDRFELQRSTHVARPFVNGCQAHRPTGALQR